ncbi:MAG TPA: cupin domain-containing protein [Paenisporosarcina sp.]|nr:cupin domain-containing protein [Paenisporosarcina sp.]
MSFTYKLFRFKDDGTIPNNPSLPVIFYPGAFKIHPQEIESTFNLNNWQNSWVNGVFEYHHYHSNTHEVLGVRAGSARLLLGGQKGEVIKVNTGDVLVLPAGTGHKKLTSSPDFEIVGAYPDGKDYNIQTGNPSERPQVLEEIKQVEVPSTDPVYGNRGQVVDRWG